MFAELKNCGEKVSNFICNTHSVRIFNLIYRFVEFSTAEFESDTAIVTYYTSDSNKTIPTFRFEDGTINMTELRMFADRVKLNGSGIDTERLQSILACSVGLTASPIACVTGGWLDNPSTYLMVESERNTRISYRNALETLPELHKKLFYYALPSMTIKNDEEHVIRVENMILKQSGNKMEFTPTNKSLLLRFNGKPNCLATPIVLGAVYKPNFVNDTVRYTTIKPSTLGQIRC